MPWISIGVSTAELLAIPHFRLFSFNLHTLLNWKVPFYHTIQDKNALYLRPEVSIGSILVRKSTKHWILTEFCTCCSFHLICSLLHFGIQGIKRNLAFGNMLLFNHILSCYFSLTELTKSVIWSGIPKLLHIPVCFCFYLIENCSSKTTYITLVLSQVPEPWLGVS